MAHYAETKIKVRATEPIDGLKLGTVWPVHLDDSQGKTILVLHYEDQAAADAASDALSNISAGLVGVTASPILPT